LARDTFEIEEEIGHPPQVKLSDSILSHLFFILFITFNVQEIKRQKCQRLQVL
jgi:hypothetical protein